MIILAIDPGLEKLGYALFYIEKKQKKYQYLTSGLIKSNKKDKLEKRLFFLYSYLKNLIEKYSPNVVVIEQLFFFKNKKTIIPVSQVQGVILLLAAKTNIKVEFISPLAIKQAVTGYGLADKKSLQKMINLSEQIPKKKEDDEMDAIACGLAYYYINSNLIENL